MRHVTSVDGTPIAYESAGAGPDVVLIGTRAELEPGVFATAADSIARAVGGAARRATIEGAGHEPEPTRPGDRAHDVLPPG